MKIVGFIVENEKLLVDRQNKSRCDGVMSARHKNALIVANRSAEAESDLFTLCESWNSKEKPRLFPICSIHQETAPSMPSALAAMILGALGPLVRHLHSEVPQERNTGYLLQFFGYVFESFTASDRLRKGETSCGVEDGRLEIDELAIQSADLGRRIDDFMRVLLQRVSEVFSVPEPKLLVTFTDVKFNDQLNSLRTALEIIRHPAIYVMAVRSPFAEQEGDLYTMM